MQLPKKDELLKMGSLGDFLIPFMIFSAQVKDVHILLRVVLVL